MAKENPDCEENRRRQIKNSMDTPIAIKNRRGNSEEELEIYVRKRQVLPQKKNACCPDRHADRQNPGEVKQSEQNVEEDFVLKRPSYSQRRVGIDGCERQRREPAPHVSIVRQTEVEQRHGNADREIG